MTLGIARSLTHQTAQASDSSFPSTMATQDFTWRLAVTDDDLRAAYNLRDEVFVKEQGFDADREIDR